MEKIKFRGVAEDGKYIFSDSIDFEVDGYDREFCRLKDEFGNWLFVNPNSVAQFVGWDANDNEVYEGDILTDQNSNQFIARIDFKAVLKFDEETTKDVIELQLAKEI